MFYLNLLAAAIAGLKVGDVVKVTCHCRPHLDEECEITARLVRVGSTAGRAETIEQTGAPIGPGGVFSLPLRAVQEVIEQAPEPALPETLTDITTIKTAGAPALPEKFNELRSMAKELGVSAGGKRVDIEARILAKLAEVAEDAAADKEDETDADDSAGPDENDD